MLVMVQHIIHNFLKTHSITASEMQMANSKQFKQQVNATLEFYFSFRILW